MATFSDTLGQLYNQSKYEPLVADSVAKHAKVLSRLETKLISSDRYSWLRQDTTSDFTAADGMVNCSTTPVARVATPTRTTVTLGQYSKSIGMCDFANLYGDITDPVMQQIMAGVQEALQVAEYQLIHGSGTAPQAAGLSGQVSTVTDNNGAANSALTFLNGLDNVLADVKSGGTKVFLASPKMINVVRANARRAGYALPEINLNEGGEVPALMPIWSGAMFLPTEALSTVDPLGNGYESIYAVDIDSIANSFAVIHNPAPLVGFDPVIFDGGFIKVIAKSGGASQFTYMHIRANYTFALRSLQAGVRWKNLPNTPAAS